MCFVVFALQSLSTGIEHREGEVAGAGFLSKFRSEAGITPNSADNPRLSGKGRPDDAHWIRHSTWSSCLGPDHPSFVQFLKWSDFSVDNSSESRILRIGLGPIQHLGCSPAYLFSQG
jgi:hypothetical protein